MKTYSIITILIAALALGSCSSAYRSAQTPDAVYYSPEESNAPARTSSDEAVEADNPNASNYVVYSDDGNNESYGNDYDGNYSQRINMFDRPGSLYAFNNYYMGYPYMGMGLGSMMNYSYGFPSFSLGLNWGLPLGRWYSPYSYGMMYSPYGMMYSPYSYGMMYGPGYAFGGYPYYAGHGYGYYGGGYGKYLNITPRPASSWGPRRSVSSGAGIIRGVSNSEGASSPRRVFNSQNNAGAIDRSSGNSPRRVFKAKPDEHPLNVNTNRTVETERPKVRVFRRSTETNNNSTPVRSSRPVEVQRQPTETRTFQQPTRTFEQPSRTYQSAPSTPTRSSTPSRSFSPRGR